MIKRHTARGRQTIRRGISLALTALGLWLFGLTGAVDGFLLQLAALGQQPSLTVAAFNLSWQEDDYSLLPQSALLTSGRSTVLERLGLAVEEEIALLPSDPQTQAVADSPIYAQGEDDGAVVPDLPVAQASDVVSYTARGDSTSGNYLWVDEIYVANRSAETLSTQQVEGLMAVTDYTLSQGAKILILHSHGTEAYTPVGTDVYLESDPYRTTDNQQNIVRVGEEMAQVFRQAGYIVLHDTNLYDYPDYNSSYANSYAAVERWLAQYPDIALILDVHRDALTNQDGDPYRLVGADGEAAQFMLVVGSNGGGTHPDWQENLSLALQFQLQLTQDWGDLCRPLTLRSSAFNQNLSPNYLLVEIGGHGNSLQEALLGARYFAQSLVSSLDSSGAVSS